MNGNTDNKAQTLASVSHNDNMYDCSARQAWDLFGPYLHGALNGYVGIVHTQALDATAQQALENSAKALGYGTDACTYVNCAELDEASLMAAVEGVDPVVVVACDQAAASALERAYKCSLPAGMPGRVFGRSAVAFTNFGALMTDASSKQRAWGLLKQLPKFGEV